MEQTNFDRERAELIEANKRRLEELQLAQTVEQCNAAAAAARAATQIVRPRSQRPRQERDDTAQRQPVEIRRSGRARAPVSYNVDEQFRSLVGEGAAAGPRQPRGPERELDEFNMTAEELEELRARRAAEPKRRRAASEGRPAALRGPRDSGKGRRKQGGQWYDSASGVTCHWCRQKTDSRKVTCKNPKCGGGNRMPVSFCSRCLRNRHGEDAEAAEASGKWICPPCRGGCGEGCITCCNCGPCRIRARLDPTGQMKHAAASLGFDNVHDYLVHRVRLCIGQELTPEDLRRRKAEHLAKKELEVFGAAGAGAAAVGPPAAAGSGDDEEQEELGESDGEEVEEGDSEEEGEEEVEAEADGEKGTAPAIREAPAAGRAAKRARRAAAAQQGAAVAQPQPGPAPGSGASGQGRGQPRKREQARRQQARQGQVPGPAEEAGRDGEAAEEREEPQPGGSAGRGRGADRPGAAAAAAGAKRPRGRPRKSAPGEAVAAHAAAGGAEVRPRGRPPKAPRASGPGPTAETAGVADAQDQAAAARRPRGRPPKAPRRRSAEPRSASPGAARAAPALDAAQAEPETEEVGEEEQQRDAVARTGGRRTEAAAQKAARKAAAGAAAGGKAAAGSKSPARVNRRASRKPQRAA